MANRLDDGALPQSNEPSLLGVDVASPVRSLDARLRRIGDDLDGRVSIVTGAGALGRGIGIGRATAVTLASLGSRVVLVDMDEERQGYTLSCIERVGGEALSVTADVADPKQCRQVVDHAIERFGRLDILVNNVGVIGPSGTAVSVDLDSHDRAMRINVTSMLAMSQAAIPVMLKGSRGSKEGGSIVNVSSVSGLRGGHPNVFYPTSKAAVVGLTRAMAVHHGREGIRVNCAAPGMIHTPLVEARGVNDQDRRARAEANLLGVEGDAWDVADAIAFLAGPKARWITGAILPVDAGLSAGDAHKPSPS